MAKHPKIHPKHYFKLVKLVIICPNTGAEIDVTSFYLSGWSDTIHDCESVDGVNLSIDHCPSCGKSHREDIGGGFYPPIEEPS